MKIIFKISKFLHKYVGLIIAAYVLWMSVSGVLINHPALIDNFSVPSWLTPSKYRLDTNWNRRALIEAIYMNDNPKKIFICGAEGVWYSENGGENFIRMQDGFPHSPYLYRTNDILLLNNILFAGTYDGLFYCNIKNMKWKKIELNLENEIIKKIISVKNELLVFTSSYVYKSKLNVNKFKFKKYELKAKEKEDVKYSLFSLIFHMHSGDIWGLPGKLIIDSTGIILLFATLSGIYIWYMPWKKKKFKKIPSKKKRSVFNFLYKYHLKLGIYFAVLILFIGITGIFLLRPLSLTILGKKVSPEYYPSILPKNRFENKISNALYEETKESIIIYADGNFWISSTDFNKPIKKIDSKKLPIGHGINVFENYNEDEYLIGSFSGLFAIKKAGFSYKPLLPKNKKRIRITGYVKTPENKEYAAGLYKGLILLNSSAKNREFNMPSEMLDNFRWSMWSFLFSLHNGRLFNDIFGSWNTAVIFILGIMFVVVSISGTYDWLYKNVIKEKLIKVKKERQKIIINNIKTSKSFVKKENIGG